MVERTVGMGTSENAAYANFGDLRSAKSENAPDSKLGGTTFTLTLVHDQATFCATVRCSW
jgi:hypothetical protein